MTIYRDIEGAVVILVDEQGRIAMQLRDDKPGLPAANQWGLIGGLVQAGEDARAIGLREVQEQLDVRLNPEKLSLYRKHYIPEQNLTTWLFHYLLADELDNAILCEGQAWDFIGRDDPRVENIGLHHHEIVLAYWASPYMG
jgi:8-oxo-dGTP pyrophosphatase MutT (NUDIX family)